MKEITINVIDETGKKHRIVTPLEMGLNLMDVLRSHDLVEGACGGMALCATCHCYIESDHQIANQKEDELAMRIISDLLPTHQIIPINSEALIQQSGSIHCATMQLPSSHSN